MSITLAKNIYKNLPLWFLQNKGLEKIISCIESDGGTVKIVGGAIRAILRNETKPENIDLVTDLVPNKIIKCFNKNQIKCIPTGIKYGTITAISYAEKFEITTLRIDLKTYGRHAKIEFSDSWLEDAKRRDFTINAIYMDFAGNIFDPLNGLGDLKKDQVKFIGSAEKRISEDYLRMLRYVRFSSVYNKGKINEKYIISIKRNIRNIAALSRERVINELKIIFNDKDRSMYAAKIMKKTTLDQACFQTKFNLNNLKFINKSGIELDWLSRICSLTYNFEDPLVKYPLSKKQRKYWNELRIKLCEEDIKTLLSKNWKLKAYKIGKFAAIKLTFATINNIKVFKRIKEIQKFNIPVFPVKAKNLIEKGLKPGRNIGEKLIRLERIWCDSNFSLSKSELLNHIDDDMKKLKISS